MRVATLLLLLLGCSSDLGDATVVGSLTIPRCDGDQARDYTCADGRPDCDAFEIDADFPTLETFGARAVIRLQHGGRAAALSDGLVIEVPDVDAVRLGEPLPLLARRAGGSAATPIEGLRASLTVWDRCPGAQQSFALDGGITFSAFGAEAGDRVAGAFDGLGVFDGRSGERLGTVRGTFDFTVRRGSTHQRFTDL